MADINVVAATQEKIERNKVRYTAALRVAADALIRNMEHVIRRIDNDDLLTINSLGEVQRQGQEVDRLCAVLSETLDMKEYVDAHVNAAAKETADVNS